MICYVTAERGVVSNDVVSNPQAEYPPLDSNLSGRSFKRIFGTQQSTYTRTPSSSLLLSRLELSDTTIYEL